MLASARGSMQASTPTADWQYLLRRHILELGIIQICVEAALVDQLIVGALLHNVAIPHDQNLVGITDGGIVEQGTHDELIDQGGFYADLYNSQFEDVTA